MTSFDEREKGFERKFQHDQEFAFKVKARRDRLLGLWAAERLGMSGDQAAEYAMSVVAADFQEAGDEDVVRKVAGDLGAKTTEAEIREKMAEFRAIARQQLMKDA